ncbi:MAG TPA: LAGLIDADG family homing endonuclease [Thermoplasmata archaeon]|nr:LAGLIDADG family homing endonuclease [Thermoplasmata archaeon]
MALATQVVPSSLEISSRWGTVLEEAGLRARILEVRDRFPEERSVAIPFAQIEGTDAELGDLLLEHPEETLEAGRQAMKAMLPVPMEGTEFPLRLRVTGLPSVAHRWIRDIRESDLGRFLALEAIVRKVTEVRPQIREAVFLCLACKGEVHEPQEEASPVFHEPGECTHCGKPQGRTRFRLLPEKSTYTDAQRIEIQENPESLKGGAHPQGLAVLLTEDLAGRVIPGNRVVVNGVLKGLQRASASRTGLLRSTTFDLLLLGNSIEYQHQEYDEIPISEEEERLILSFRNDPQILDRIVLSLGPTIKGLEEEKEAIALQLFGGVEKHHADGIRVRGDIHILLIGDPGTGKSQLLRYIADVAPRGVYTSGKGATAAGLTAAAVKDDFGGGRWVLEAGMLVLADGGMAMVDELDKMTPEDRSAMHEVLEQQSYHPSFEIMLNNGERRPIGELVDRLLLSRPKEVRHGVDCEMLELSEQNLQLLTTDFRGLHAARAQRVSRHTAPPRFVRITYGNGRVLTVTPEHPLFLWKEGRWETRPASKAVPGDLAPGVARYPRGLNEAVLMAPEHPTSRRELLFPSRLDEGLSRLLGYIISEGHVRAASRNRALEVSISNTDPELVEDARDLFRSVFGIEPYVQFRSAESRSRAKRPIWFVRAISADLVHYFQWNFPELVRKGPFKRVPGALFHATEACRVQFLLGAYRGDGFCDSERFGLTTSSEGLARDYSDLLLTLGIYSYITRSRYRFGEGQIGTGRKIVISGAASQERFFDLIARHDPRSAKIRAFVVRSQRRAMDEDRLPRELVARFKSLLGELHLDKGRLPPSVPGGGSCHRTTLRRVAERFEARLSTLPSPRSSHGTARELRRSYCIPRREVARQLHRSEAWVGLHDRSGRSLQGQSVLRATTDLAEQKVTRLSRELRELKEWLESPLRFVPIRRVEVIANAGEPWVYDVTVEPTHTFVSEGLVLHNTVSVAKAGITATLNARCPVLAAANPKWGRFSRDRTVSEQIDLPPTLLSRFDVIYSIQDKPDQKRDRLLASRILQSHQEGEARDVSLPPPSGPPTAGAAFPPEFLRKYIAYARRTIRPVLTDAALRVIEDFYVQIRRQGEEPDAPVPITARQLEALVRLAEASARARLSAEASADDAGRATRIVEGFLRRVSSAEGKLDIDIVATGVSHSQRERIDLLLGAMRQLQERAGSFSFEQVVAEMEKQNVPRNRTEALFQSLRSQGELVESRPDVWQLARF